MATPFADLTDEERRLLKKKRQPRWITPMKAILTESYFSDPEWIFEPKLDGQRCLAFKQSGVVTLLSRNNRKINPSYPELVDAIGSQRGNVVLDGEIVAFHKGVPSFARLQRRMHVGDAEKARRIGVPVYLYLFDILYADGYETLGLPLIARKKVLKRAVSFGGPLRFVRHRKEHGEAYLRETCEKTGWEGLIAKRADSTYKQTRSTEWLKFKCVNEQELVIGGYTDPQGSRTGLGALLVGYYEDGVLRYAGKVGTGYGSETLELISRALRRRERKTSPFADAPRSARAHWVRPDLVAQIGFSEWTGDGRLRHPRFLGLRRDKSAKEVVRETPSG
jgi:bifunctional non-homologous end joining protein LigD